MYMQYSSVSVALNVRTFGLFGNQMFFACIVHSHKPDMQFGKYKFVSAHRCMHGARRLHVVSKLNSSRILVMHSYVSETHDIEATMWSIMYGKIIFDVIFVWFLYFVKTLAHAVL